MNLREFYKKCPRKYEFISRVQERTGVSANSVLNWCKGYMKPGNDHKKQVLSEETGIPVDELF